MNGVVNIICFLSSIFYEHGTSNHELYYFMHSHYIKEISFKVSNPLPQEKTMKIGNW